MAPLIWRMLLARCCVKKAFKTARVCLIRHAPLKAFLYSPRIQNHCAKSETFGFFKTNSEIVGIALLRSNGRKGLCPFNGSGTADWRVPLLGLGFEIWEIGAELYQLFLKFSRVDFMD